LAAFFTLPAIFEQKYVHVDTLVQGYYEYIAHFVSTSQLLFSRFWGYGPSIWGTNDGMPFQVGHIHWILSLIIFGFILFKLLKKKFDYSLVPIAYCLLIGWFAAFMAHVRSTPIWQILPFLKFVQFPWRFLTIVTFCFSFLAGAVPVFLKKLSTKYYVLCTAILAIGLIAFNWNYFLPKGGKMGALTDEEKFSGAAWGLQQTAGIFDYLPKTAVENPKESQKVLAEIMTGKGEVIEPNQGTNWAKFKVQVDSEQATVRINIFDFPNWKIFIDGKAVEKFISKDERWGRMYFEASQGDHQVYLKLYNTPLRTLANIISLVSWVGLVSLVCRKKH
jgi:hypothetical protein